MFQTFHQRWLKSVNRAEKKITSVFVQVWLFQMALKTPSCHSILFFMPAETSLFDEIQRDNAEIY